VFALSGLGGENDVSRVERGRWNKKVEKHWDKRNVFCLRSTALIR